jgi:HAD superfamily phosphoserine phosphatase-like hydrolase
MKSNIIIFSDFDGTITKQDVLDDVITKIFSFDIYKKVENELLTDKLKYEDYLYKMFDGINYDLNNISTDLIDEYFCIFYEWIINNNVDFFILSSGFKKIIQHLIPYVDSNLIFGNDVTIDANKWKVILYEENNKKSINKVEVINKLKKDNCKTVFIGDGLSDFKVIGNVDYLFCKKYSLLHQKCIDNNSEHIVYDNFNDVLQKITRLFDKKLNI